MRRKSLAIRRILAAAGCAAIVSTAAFGQSAPPLHHHGSHDPASTAHVANAALAAINARMHADMEIPPSGNPDIDFARGMIPHHQGAVDMARWVMEYGTDPELRALAQEIVAAQEKEIAFLQDWLARNAP